MIQSWSDAFQQQPDMQGVVQVYQELKSKGIEFPMTNMDTMAPIITPQRTFNETAIPSAAAAVRPTFPRSAPVEHVAPYERGHRTFLKTILHECFINLFTFPWTTRRWRCATERTCQSRPLPYSNLSKIAYVKTWMNIIMFTVKKLTNLMIACWQKLSARRRRLRWRSARRLRRQSHQSRWATVKHCSMLFGWATLWQGWWRRCGSSH